FDLGGPEPVRLGQLIDQLTRLLGSRRVPVPVPVPLLTAMARIGGRVRPARMLHALEMLQSDRTVEAPDPALWSGRLTSFDTGLRLAIGRYQL
ncbi:MAG: hypothetical protein M3256_20330, partial [Actinomycetota bacterium]|nr:hypothetical protein [Actinomycetota bacterium]